MKEFVSKYRATNLLRIDSQTIYPHNFVIILRVFPVPRVHAGDIGKYDTLLEIVKKRNVSYSYDM